MKLISPAAAVVWAAAAGCCTFQAPTAATLPVTAVAEAPAPSPSDVIQQAAQGALHELAAKRDTYRKNPSDIRSLVDKYLLPHFDTEYAARLVLGQNWRTATAEQRRRFIEAFYRSLLTHYSGALIDLTPDQLRIFPTPVEPSASQATVRTEVRHGNADRIAVNYSMHKTLGSWKVYDVSVDGISYVKSYREDFAEQIQQQGLESVIVRLEKGVGSPGNSQPLPLPSGGPL
ncbi:MAG: ABC transporter substrate-binding protein [Proteobacteria bacterium]|nr:ABC transporter substrate-binding protein [Pseudomonadota bacterium]